MLLRGFFFGKGGGGEGWALRLHGFTAFSVLPSLSLSLFLLVVDCTTVLST